MIINDGNISLVFERFMKSTNPNKAFPVHVRYLLGEADLLSDRLPTEDALLDQLKFILRELYAASEGNF